MISKSSKKKKRCPKCGVVGNQIIKVGKRYTRERRAIQKYHCNRCNHVFSEKTMMYRMRVPRWKLTKAIELRKEGKTLAQIKEAIGGVSRTAIHKWLAERTYARKLIVTSVTVKPYISMKSGKPVKVKEHKQEVIIRVPR
jgi:transposase-like protein